MLLKHWQEVHSDKEEAPKFEFKVVERCNSALERQIKESLAISEDESVHPMNSKTEFGRNWTVQQQFEGRPAPKEPPPAPPGPPKPPQPQGGPRSQTGRGEGRTQGNLL